MVASLTLGSDLRRKNHYITKLSHISRVPPEAPVGAIFIKFAQTLINQSCKFFVYQF